MPREGIQNKFFTLLFFLEVFFLLSGSVFATEQEVENNFDLDNAENPHIKIFANNQYPSASQCKTCHSRQYKEWSVSQHAYAQLSPVYMAMQNTTNREQSGTNGDFCIRCHSPVGMQESGSVYRSNLERPQVVREGVTCIVCHRQSKDYGKVSGRVSLVKGELTEPVYGPLGNDVLKRVLTNKSLKLVTEPKQKGRKIHKDIKPFFALTTPKFCGSCHDVTLINGFRLEEAFSEFRHSPANKRGETCQDCHMGKSPGKAQGYNNGPAARVGRKNTPSRKITNHYFAGPDYSVLHPGIFPHNVEASKLATMEEWLKFDYKAGWGTDEFEDAVDEGTYFPKPWDSVETRYDARDILDEQFELLAWAKKQRQAVLEAGYKIDKVVVDKADDEGIIFRVKVKNNTDGHNVPTGFIGERLVFLEVTLKDKDGHIVYQSGDRDPNGDIRDLHSYYVHKGRVSEDKDLFSLQSPFVIRNIRGGERESIIPVNRSFDPRPFVRPPVFSAILTGSPMNARLHKKGLPPGSHRWARYNINKVKLEGAAGPYKATIRLVAQMVPVNLLTRIQDVGFDFHMSTKEIAEKVVDEAHVVQQEIVLFYEGDNKRLVAKMEGSNK